MTETRYEDYYKEVQARMEARASWERFETMIEAFVKFGALAAIILINLLILVLIFRVGGA